MKWTPRDWQAPSWRPCRPLLGAFCVSPPCGAAAEDMGLPLTTTAAVGEELAVRGLQDAPNAPSGRVRGTSGKLTGRRIASNGRSRAPEG